LARRLPIGAELIEGGNAHFRVWAPRCQTVEVVIEGAQGEELASAELTREQHGYFSGLCADAVAGSLYRYRLDGTADRLPDPASRFQPDGPHGPSQIIDPSSFEWTDTAWPGVAPVRRVVYEMHAGTFTSEGNWEAAARELRELAACGITMVELMPVAEFPGRFGWGYDGVMLFAPSRLYGAPDDLRRFVDQAHSAGLGVMLDVVYNHIGPDGNCLDRFSDHYFSSRHETEWGKALNFDGEHCAPVREFFVANALYWIDEFHLDGLRLDATQSIFDTSRRHIVAELTDRLRAVPRRRELYIAAENEPQQAETVRSTSDGGWGVDALWNDDFHHSARVALTGKREAYYQDYRGLPQELVSAVKHGFLFQGQRYAWQKKRRGSPTLGLEPWRFVHYLQNHDQIANSARGDRLHALTSPGRYRAMTALLLLAPQTPLLFQGQEFASSAPFLYFADHRPELARLVRKGRAEFLSQFPSIATLEARSALPDPGDERTFDQCKLDLEERQRHGQAYALHRDLLQLRHGDPTFGAPRAGGVDGAVLASSAFLLRYFGAERQDRVLIVNLGSALPFESVAEPLLAPPPHARWELMWSSDDHRYGGGGTPPVETEEGAWCIPAESAVVLAAHRQRTGDD
jgi:maltooligosyltrehalose trehalohydrolase